MHRFEFISNSSYTKKADIGLEVSGIGGVVPADNFTINVDVEYTEQGNHIVAVQRRSIPPSTLPSPSYVFHYTSSSSDGSEAKNDDLYTLDPHRRIILKQDSTDSGQDGSVSDDSSIDMLAHARKVEPESIAILEREYDTNENEPDFRRQHIRQVRGVKRSIENLSNQTIMCKRQCI